MCQLDVQVTFKFSFLKKWACPCQSGHLAIHAVPCYYLYLASPTLPNAQIGRGKPTFLKMKI
jgi:hypothetical protein